MYMPVFLFCLCILSLTHAQFHPTSRGNCIQFCHNEHISAYDGTLASPDATIPWKWCTYWGYECDCIHKECSTFQINCNYLGTSRDCSVDVDQDVIPPRALVPRPTTGTGPTTGTTPSTTSSTSLATPWLTTVSFENPRASAGAATGTIVLLVGAALGSLFTVNYAVSSPSAFSSHGYGDGHTTMIPTSVGTVGVQASFLLQCASAVDPVSLLLQFQFLSFSGLLLLEYPPNYLGFTYNFTWANFLIPFPPFKKAANGLMSKSCWKARLDERSLGGFDLLAARYGIPVHDLAGVIYICVSAGIGIALVFFALVSAILFLLERMTRSSTKHKTIRGAQERWVAISSNMTLRLFIWILGTICTFAFFQFAHSCGGTSLAVAIIELVIIVATLLIASMLIRRVASSPNGLDALFAQDEHSKYAHRWGSLYIKLKRETYWFFIPQYFWVIIRSAFIAFTQLGSLIQICLLIGLELLIFLVLLFKRPFGTAGANAVNITESGYRLASKALLSTFLTNFALEDNLKNTIGVVLLSLGIAWAGALFLLLITKAGAGFIDWRIQRRQKSESLQPQMIS